MIFAILGPSGVGKTTISNKLGLPQVISTTTRKIRPGEVQDVTYHYVDVNEFDELDLLESVEYAGNKYGLQSADVYAALESDEDHYVILDRKGCDIIKSIYTDVFVVYLTASPQELVGFMRKRGDDDKAIIDRLCNIIADDELDNNDIADLICETGTIDEVAEKIRKFIKSRHKWRSQ